MKTGVEKLFIRIIIIIIENLHFYVKQILISVFFQSIIKFALPFCSFYIRKETICNNYEWCYQMVMVGSKNFIGNEVKRR